MALKDLIMSPVQKIVDIVKERYLNKAIKQVVQLIVARILALNLDRFGISVDPELATVALLGAIEGLRNLLKHKYGWPLP